MTDLPITVTKPQLHMEMKILLTLSYNTMTDLPITVTKPQLHMEMKMVIHLHAELSVTDKQLCEAFFEYIIIILRYVCLL